MLEMKCLKNVEGATRMNGVRNEEVRRSAQIERSLGVQWIRECSDGLNTWREWMRTVCPEWFLVYGDSKWKVGVGYLGRLGLGWINGMKVSLGSSGMKVDYLFALSK